MNAIAQSFGISRTQSRAAVVLFSNSASVKIRFTDYASTGAFQVNNYIFFHCGLRRLFHVLSLIPNTIAHVQYIKILT